MMTTATALRKVFVSAVAAAVLATGVAIAAPGGASPATAATSSVPVHRISGSDRYATAANIAKQWTSASTVWIATGTDYADALSAGPAAAHQGAPLLLTAPTSLPSAAAAQLKRLKPSTIVIAGGTQAVSAAVATTLKGYAKTVTRLAGTDRYDTSRKVINYAFAKADVQNRVVFMATGTNFPDALSAGALAGSVSLPVILINGRESKVDSATAAELTSENFGGVGIVGGTAAISSGIEKSLAPLFDASNAVMRFAGSDRYETNAELIPYGSYSNSDAMLATGTNYADALSGVPLAAKLHAALFLSQPNCIPSETGTGIANVEASGLILLGGTSALSAAVAKPTICKS